MNILSHITGLFQRKVVRNFSYITFSNVLVQLLSLLSNIKIIRVLGPESYGVYAFILSQYLLFSTISLFGIRNIQIRNISRGTQKTKKQLVSAFFIQIIGFSISIALFFIYDALVGSVCRNYLFLFILCIVFNNLWDIIESIWYGYQKMLIPSLLNVCLMFVWAVTIFILPIDKFSITNLLLIFTLLLFLKFFILLIFTFYHKLLKGKIDGLFNEIISIVKESAPLYLTVLVSLPTNYLSNNFLDIRSSERELGYFNANNKLIQPLITLINLAVIAIFPNLSNSWKLQNKEEFFLKIEKGLKLFVIIFSLFAVIISLLKVELVSLLFGADFISVANVVMYQVWFVVIFGLNGIIGMIWIAVNRQSLVARYSILNSLIATPLLWFGSKYGAEGLSISYFVAYLSFFPILWYQFYKTMDKKIHLTREFAFLFLLMCFSLLIPKELLLLIRICCIIFIFVITYFLFGKSIISFLKK